MQEFIRDFWALIFAIIAACAGVGRWLMLLAAQVKANTTAINEIVRQRHEDLKTAQRGRDETNGYLKEMREENKEIRSDIKLILQRIGK